MIKLVEEFLRRINADEEIREHLVNFPFNAKNLDFTISLRDKNGHAIKNDNANIDLIYSVQLLKGEIDYHILNEMQAALQTIHTETYDEALAIVKKTHPEVLPPPETSKEN
jgi:hypothetical protein